jgi:ribosomal protein S18 acetylase RimI-like enzyme
MVVEDRYERIAGVVTSFDYDFSTKAVLQEYKIYLEWAGIFKTIGFLHREAVVNKYWVLPDKDSLYIAFYSIAPRWQGTGLSRYLFEEALNFAKNQGYRKVELDVDIDNEKAKKLYSKMGFQIKQILNYGNLENKYKIPATQVMLKYL